MMETEGRLALIKVNEKSALEFDDKMRLLHMKSWCSWWTNIHFIHALVIEWM